jgi:outer membrane protein assembly factor BamB
LDAATGEVVWKTMRDEPTTWATPLIVEHAGKTQVIANGITVRSYDLETGELIWSCGGQAFNPIPCPISHDGMVFCMTGYRGNAVYAISLDAIGDVTGSKHVVWSRNDTGPYVSSAALDAGRIYLTKSRTGILSVLDAATGRAIIDKHRLGGMNTLYASPVVAAGRVYFSSREGTTVVLAADDEVQVLATNHLEETIDASPAVVDQQMFIRGARHLFCIEERD